MRGILLLSTILFFAVSCSSQKIRDTSVLDFAMANCMFQYFESKGYDSDGLRAIAGGIVEMSERPVEDFTQVALFIENYQTKMKTKNNVDPLLARCFEMKSDAEFLRLVR